MKRPDPSQTEDASVSKRRVFVAEDHELARYGLALALEESGRFEICGEADDGARAVEAVLRGSAPPPDIVLMDIGLPGKDGIRATREIKEALPNLRVIMLTSHRDEEEVFAALAAGADAYCIKDIKLDRLMQVMDIVMDGAIWLDPAIARMVMTALPGAAPNAPGHAQSRRRYNTELTERESEVLRLIVEGKSNKEIAQILKVTTHTAKAHVCSIIQKLAVDDRTQAAVKALQEGLIQ